MRILQIRRVFEVRGCHVGKFGKVGERWLRLLAREIGCEKAWLGWEGVMFCARHNKDKWDEVYEFPKT